MDNTVSPWERFSAWLDAIGWTNAEAARQLRISPPMVRFLRTGERTAGLETAVAIERLSGSWVDGPILVEEWLTTGRGEPPVEAVPEAG